MSIISEMHQIVNTLMKQMIVFKVALFQMIKVENTTCIWSSCFVFLEMIGHSV